MLNIVNLFRDKSGSGKKISVLTCYDYTFARLLNKSDIDALLVGDSLGMVINGHESTLPVSMEDMIYHCRAVKKGAPDKPIICDMPFMSYQSSVSDAVFNAGRLMKEGCHAVKLEGADEHTLTVIKRLTESGIPVMGHIGLTPQSVHTLGGFRVQGKDKDSEKMILEAAGKLGAAGAFSLLLEMIPGALAVKITKTVGVPTIGIGAGNHTSGQVLVVYDMLGMDPDFTPKYLKKFAELGKTIIQASNQYHAEVNKASYPGEDNTFH